MTWLIGTDEAGYGPNLGPLCVSASCWRVANVTNPTESPTNQDAALIRQTECFRQPTFFDELDETESGLTPEAECLYNFDASVPIQLLNEQQGTVCGRRGVFPLIDSKKLYHASGGLAPLERSVAIALHLCGCGESMSDFRTLLQRVCRQKHESEPYCERGFNPILPLDVKTGTATALRDKVQLVQESFSAHTIQLVNMICRRIQPEEFNRLLQSRLKSDLLADATLELVRESIASLDRGSEGESMEPVIVLCDKLGGRNKYRFLLEEHFPNAIIDVIVESRELSRYVFRLRERPIEVRFQMKGESNIPTAMASIFSKYLRELSMLAFNGWWETQVPGLSPTAGYPEDAKRYMAAIGDAMSRANISRSQIWRDK